MRIVSLLSTCVFHATFAAAQCSDGVVAVLKDYTLDRDIDLESIGEVVTPKPRTLSEDVIAKIEAAEKSGSPLVFTMVGFPFKSANGSLKVIASRIDAAERYSLVYLNEAMKKIAAVYKPGAKLVIFTDGMVFCDIEGVSDKAVEEYETALKRICKDLRHIEIKTLTDLSPGKSPRAIREIIEADAADDAAILSLPSSLEEIALLKKRMAFEFAHPKGAEQTANLSQIATKLTLRSAKYSRFLDAYRPKTSVRLSVHYQPDGSKKIGVKLSPNSCVTPWHGALVAGADGWRIEHKRDVNLTDVTETAMIVNGVTLPYYLENRRRG